MLDLVFVLVTVSFFAISAAYVGACARIIGREELSEPDTSEPEALGGAQIQGVSR